MTKLSEAAERLRRGEYGHDPVGMYQWNHDVKLTSNAYLAEHRADDGEYTTEEWLDSVLDRERMDDDITYWTPGRGICIHLDGGVYIQNEEYGPAKTRGDVRNLCRALGIELEETERQNEENL